MAERIALTKRMLLQAERYQTTILSTTTLRRRGNFTALASERRYFFGYLGELAFAKLLEEAGKHFVHLKRADGRRLKYKFVLETKVGRRILASVSTASEPFHSFVMMPEIKLMRDECTHYVAVRLDLSRMVAEVWGIIAKRELFERGSFEMENGVKTYRLPLYEAEPISNILPELKDEFAPVA